MGLTPEERRRIYEEEKARLEAEKAQQGTTSTGLKQNVASLLCYAGFWVTGIIFLILEKTNRVVRFHAAQSLVVFGFLSVTSFVLGFLPIVGHAINAILGIITFILWIVLMVKAYQGELYRLPVAADIADDIAGPLPSQPPPPAPAAAAPVAAAPPRTDWGRAGRITAYAFGIAWDVVLLIFFNFFSRYIAYYHMAGGVLIREPLLTSDFNRWLPIITATLALHIVGHIILVIFDAYPVRTSVRLALDILSLWAVASLLAIFPFNFGVIPDPVAVDAVTWSVIGTLALVILILAIAVIVRLIQLLLYLLRVSPRR